MPLANTALGRPPEAKLLLLNCDDLGLDEDVNLAVVEAVRDGIAASTSLMTACPAAAHAMRLLRRHPEIPYGVHLTLVCERPRHPWGPLVSADPLATDGRLPTPDAWRARPHPPRLDHVEREFRAQIDATTATGRAPTHLDFHCLADGGHPDVLDLTLALGAEYGLAVRVWLPPALDRMRERGLPVVDHGFLDSFSVPLDDKPAHYARLLAELPPGLTEWALHPALARPNYRALDDGWRVRRSDYEFLLSPEAPRLLAEHGITVLDYRPLQSLWPRST
ncbi:ChbG/HpnK family deacetylase [Streptomyces sp. NRRL WC-3742]|uniref:ChbG/HpnK family deacetylase n=1 Tax=Streptomyces sp. NRRL WC-3742 TaxID=1463934 RepID=UPI0004C88048|nr:ChbG/HpnK family deacetylase [Streptomyces sp. NRRL WC-3742]